MEVKIMETVREVFYVNEKTAEDVLKYATCVPSHPLRTVQEAVEESVKFYDAEERETLKCYRVTVTVEEIPLETQI